MNALKQNLLASQFVSFNLLHITSSKIRTRRAKKLTAYIHLKTSSISRHLLARLANKTCITQASQNQKRRQDRTENTASGITLQNKVPVEEGEETSF